MLDLGFREDLDAILALLPKERRSHLVSATFSRDVVSLADRFQKDPVHVQGTRLGEANVDIEHVVHLVEPRQRIDALINLLLADEDAKSLVFARTRADVARVAGELAEAGFVVRTLSGEMEQPERDRALAAFRQGGVQALVATDVAARGIDVRDVARVIQIEPPTDVETYTHRSGRTGRAGKQGTSVLFVAPSHYQAIARGLSRAKIAHRVEPIPRPDAIQRAREEKLVAWLARDGDGETIDPHAHLDRREASSRAARSSARSRGSSRRRGCTGPRARATSAPSPRLATTVHPRSNAAATTGLARDATTTGARARSVEASAVRLRRVVATTAAARDGSPSVRRGVGSRARTRDGCWRSRAGAGTSRAATSAPSASRRTTRSSTSRAPWPIASRPPRRSPILAIRACRSAGRTGPRRRRRTAPTAPCVRTVRRGRVLRGPPLLIARRGRVMPAPRLRIVRRDLARVRGPAWSRGPGGRGPKGRS